MCLQVKKKKYMYLSMCSCCNIVSKYSVAVKKHIQAYHSQVSQKKSPKVVVPIRVDGRLVRSIVRSLDKKRSLKKVRGQSSSLDTLQDDLVAIRNNTDVQKAAVTGNVCRAGSILCTICNKKFEGLVSYFHHMLGEDHRNVKICFRCTECSCLFPSIKELLNHNKIHTDRKDQSVFKLVCVSATKGIADTTQCPYCVNLFENFEQLYLHIGDKHFTCLDITKVKADTTQNTENDAEIDLLSYKCKYCPESLHALSDFLQHISDKHKEHIIQSSKQPRKRTLPKWSKEDGYERNVKKSRRLKIGETLVEPSEVDKPNISEVKTVKKKEDELRQKSKEQRTNKNESCAREAKQEKVFSSIALSPYVLLKRIDEPETRIREKDVDSMKMKGSEKKGLTKSQEKLDHDYSKQKELETNTEKGTESITNKKIEGVSKSRNEDRLARKSVGVNQSPGAGNLTDEENLTKMSMSIEQSSGDDIFPDEEGMTEYSDEDMAGDSDDDYVDEMDSEKAIQYLSSEKICQYCSNAKFKDMLSLEKHIQLEHPGPSATSVCIEMYKDEPAGTEEENTKKEVAFQNKQSHIEVVAVSKEESTDYGKRERLTIGAETNTVTYVNKFKCPFCEFYLYHKDYVYSHIREAHPEIEHFTAGDIVKETVQLRQSELHRESFNCPCCDFSSRWKNQLMQHFRYRHSDKPPIKNLPCRLPKVYSDREAASAKLRCPKCEKIVTGKVSLEKHMQEHTGAEPCELQYHSYLSEPENMAKPCKKLISFLCPYCDAVFTRKDTLKFHKCTDDPPLHRFLPVIKCVLMKPLFGARDRRQSRNAGLVESINQENDGISGQKEARNINETEELVLRNGMFICPVCDSFTTMSKGQAVTHIARIHGNKSREVDILYILEGFLETTGDNNEGAVSVICKNCYFSSDNLTDILRHSKKHEYDAESGRNGVENTNTTVAIGDDVKEEKAQENGLVTLSQGQGIELRKSLPFSETVSQLSPRHKIMENKSSSLLVKEKEIMSNYRTIKIKNKTGDGASTDHVVTVVKYKCPFCAFYLYHKEYVYSHIQKMHPEVEYFSAGDVVKETVNLKEGEVNRECFKCQYCNFTSNWKNLLLHHLRSSHSGKQQGNVECILPVSGDITDTLTGESPCPVCKVVFTGKDTLGKHMVAHLQGKSYSPEFYIFLPEPEALSKPDKKLVSWLCPYCDLVFTRKDSVKSHLNTHLEDTSVQKSPIIKCVLVKPGSVEGNGSEITGEKEAENTKMKNTRITKQINQKNQDVLKGNQANLKTGTYICPICDNFKTFSKDVAVVHMESNHRHRLPEVEIVYIVEALHDRKKTRGMFIHCGVCDFSVDNLTDIVRHIKSNGNHQESREIPNENIAGTGGTPGGENMTTAHQFGQNETSQLFEIVSLTNPEIGSSEEVYKCWQCSPTKMCKTRKYLKRHTAKNHRNKDLFDVSLAMNEMMNSLDGTLIKGFQCTLCFEQTDRETVLLQHFRDKHPENVLQVVCQLMNEENAAGTVCEICHVRCLDNVSLRKHLLLHVNKRRTHCPTCGIYLETSEEVASHSASVHAKSSHMCNICGKIFMKNKDFLRHMRGHKVDGDPADNKVLCQHCGTEILRYSFKRHMLRFHAAHLICDCVICTRQVVPVGKVPVKCNSCNQVFCTSFMLNAHKRRIHSKNDLHRAGNSSVMTECHCDQCGLIFENILQFHGHKCSEGINDISSSLLLDTEQLDVSDSEYDGNEKITADISADIINEKYLEFSGSMELPYSCRICHKSFKIKKYLYNHVRRKHSDDESKRFRCKVCKMGFARMNALRRHCKFHLGVRPHPCKVCNRSFKTASQLKEHMRIHLEKHNPQLKCRYCERKFIQNGALMAHVMFHCKIKPYVCPYCKKAFASSGELRRHMDRYLEGKKIGGDSFVCSFCKKEFPNRHFLMKHFYKHGPENPFHCSVCQKRFNSFQQMYTHKDKTDHFTVEEIEEAKAELQKPAGNFKPLEERKELWSKRKIKGVMNAETAVATSMLNKSLDIQGQSTGEPVLDSQDYVEVEISNSIHEDNSQNESTKAALSLFENNVLQSMFQVDTPGIDSEDEETQLIVKYDQQNPNEYVIERLSGYQVQSDEAVEVSSKEGVVVEEGESFEMETGSENISEIATIVAQNIQSQETGQTQVYQTPDGSVIHVCVIKPNRE